MVTGCGKSGETKPIVIDKSMTNLLAIHTAYTESIAASKKPPRNVEDLEKTLQEMDRPTLNKMFRSPHDRQPYVIIWGIMLNSDPSSTPTVLAYEKEGIGGTRYVLLTNGTCQTMTQAEFDQAPKAAR